MNPHTTLNLAKIALCAVETVLKHYGQGHKRQTTKRGLLTTNKG